MSPKESPPTPSVPAPSSAKLTPPALGAVLERSRLLEPLGRVRMAWICGPAGAGKTALAANHFRRQERSALWYHLEAEDADPRAFFAGLADASGRILPGRALPRLERAQGLAAFGREFLRRLFGAPEGGLLLVLDDYHVLPAEARLHEVLREALEEIPPHGQVVVTSRLEPPPAFARLYTQPCFRRLGWEELRLTEAESIALGRLRLGEAGAAACRDGWYPETQGWVTGLILMLGQGEEPPPAAMALPAVFDYYAGEVWPGLDPAWHRALIGGALMPAMTGAWVAALTGEAAAEAILEELVRRHCFTQRTQRVSGPAYTFHTLFRRFLLARGAAAFGQPEWMELQRRAAGLLAEAGEGEAAMALWAGLGDWAAAARFIVGEAPRLIRQGQVATLSRWLEKLPESEAGAPWLRYYAGVCRSNAAPGQARSLFAAAYEGFQITADGTGLWAAWSGAAESFIHEWSGFADADPWLERFVTLWLGQREKLALEGELAAIAAYFSLLIYRRPEDPDRDLWAARLERRLHASPDPEARMQAGNRLLLYHVWWTGDMHRATPLIALLRPDSGDASPQVRILWHIAEAAYGWMSGDGERSRGAVRRALAVAEGSGIHRWDFMLRAQEVWAALSGGDAAEAHRALDDLGCLLEPWRRVDHGHYCLLAFTLAWLEERWDAMVHWAAQGQASADASGSPWARALLLPATARSRLHLGDRIGALAALEESRQLSVDPHEALAAAAELALDEGDPERCRALLVPLLARGRCQGRFNGAYWRGSTMSRLCRFALEQGIEVEYVRHLIRRRRLPPPADAAPLEQWPWPVRIHTLGRFLVQVDDRPAITSGKSQTKPLELLQALIACGACQVPQERLSDLLWPDSSGDAARRTLDTNLFRLRKLLGGHPLINLADGRLSLDRRHCCCDLWTLDETLDGIERLLPAPNHGPSLATLTDRLHLLYQGPFLLFPHAPSWAHPVHHRLQRRLERLLPRLGLALTRLDDEARAERCREVAWRMADYRD